MSERISEQIEFLTQVHTAWDGTEQRAALRGRPRRYVSYEYIGVNTAQSQYLRALAASEQTRILQFPLWHANTILGQTVYRGQSIVPLAKEDMWNYRGCVGAMLWKNDEDGGEYFDAQTITADGVLRLKKQTSADWLSYKTVVVPVFHGILRQEGNYADAASNITNMTLNVEFINRGLGLGLPAAVGEWNYPRLTFPESKNAPAEYMGRELFMAPPPWSDDIASRYARNANRLDNQTGAIRYDLKSSETTETRSLSYSAISRGEIQFLQRFFYRCKGRLKSFYAPTWINDVDLAEDAITGNELITKFNLYWKYYEPNKRRRCLIVFFADGTVEILKIAGYGLDDTRKRGRIFLDAPIKRPIIRRQIRMISFLCLYRLNSDALATDYETTGIANMNLEITEVSE